VGDRACLDRGSRLADVNWWVLVPAGRGGAITELVVATALLAWALVRVVGRSGSSPKRRKPKKPRMGPAGLLGTGTLFVLSAAFDPTFVALAVVAGRSDSVAAVGGAQLIWSLISQAPLLVLLIAVVRGGHERAVQRFQTGWERVAPTLRLVVTGALVVVGSLLLIDAIWWFVTGDFLLPAP
jgi:cytochrome c biogenesis protein CcdA